MITLKQALAAIDPQDPNHYARRIAVLERYGDEEAAEQARYEVRTMARLARYNQLDGSFMVHSSDNPPEKHLARWQSGGWYLIYGEDIECFADTRAVYFAPRYCHYGDYDDMGLVGKANCKALEDAAEAFDEAISGDEVEEMDGRCGPYFPAHTDLSAYAERHYAYGGAQALILIRADTDEMLEMLAGLDNYPLIDEHLCGEIEIEDQDRQWRDWGAFEVMRAIESTHSADFIGDDFDAWMSDQEPWEHLRWEADGPGQTLRGVDDFVSSLERDDLIESGLWVADE